MDNMDNLFKAGIKGLSAGFTLGVLVIIIALLIFIYKKFILPAFSKTKDLGIAVTNHGTEAIKDYVDKHAHSNTQWSSENDNMLYEYVLEEIEKNNLQKGLWAKALALSEGNNDKAKSLYMQYRVQAIKEELSRLHIDPSSLSPQRIWHIIENGITPEEQASFQEESEDKIKSQHNAKANLEKAKYNKFGGWLIFFAILIVIGNLGLLSIVEYFTSAYDQSMANLLNKNLDVLVAYFNTNAYLGFAVVFLNILLTITFFTKSRHIKTVVLIVFVGYMLTALAHSGLVLNLQQQLAKEVFDAIYSSNYIFEIYISPILSLIVAIIWGSYFLTSKRAHYTFVKEYDLPTIIFISAIIPVGLLMVYGGNAKQWKYIKTPSIVEEHTSKEESFEDMIKNLKEKEAQRQEESKTKVDTQQPSTTTPPVTTIANADAGIYIHVGSVATNPEQRILNDIKAKGFEYRLHTNVINGNSVTKILIGPYTKSEDAQSALVSVRESLNKNAYLYRIK